MPVLVRGTVIEHSAATPLNAHFPAASSFHVAVRRQDDETYRTDDEAFPGTPHILSVLELVPTEDYEIPQTIALSASNRSGVIASQSTWPTASRSIHRPARRRPARL